MRLNLPALVFAVLMVQGCAVSPMDCASVSTIKANSSACTGRTIQVEAYLVSTRHGEYLADAPDDSEVLRVVFSEQEEHREAVVILLDKLGHANVGKPFAEIHGTFEGRLVGTDSNSLHLEIHSEVD